MLVATVRSQTVVALDEFEDSSNPQVTATSIELTSSYTVEHPLRETEVVETKTERKAPPGAQFVIVEPGVEIGDSYIDGVLSKNTFVTIESLKAYLANQRYLLEIGGLEINGSIIDTSRESQAKIASANLLAQIDPEEPIAFKASNGWVTLDSATMQAIAVTVGRFVRDLYKVEEKIETQINDGSISSFAGIDAALDELI
jgi:hypothetical protein